VNAHDRYERLAKLEQILAQPIAIGGGATHDPAQTREEQAQRLRQLTGELQRGGADTDEIDALAMRLLLNDYVALVTSLRAIARQAETHVIGAYGSITETRRRFDQQEKLRLKRAGRTSA
jgi:hypothetical protein